MQQANLQQMDTADADRPESEARLITRTRAGDMAAFEALYRRHCGRIYAVCLRLSGNPALAEECVQDTFVTAWQKLAGFRGDSAFSTWLHRIAVNTVLGRHRSRMRQANWFVDAESEQIEAVPAVETDEATLRDLEEAIAELPDGARQVFVLFDVEGHTHDEIAELTGLAVGTCKAQLHRARKLLRGRMQA